MANEQAAKPKILIIEKDPAHPKHIQTIWGTGYRFC
jgi:DNA-binding response OmpR family regulator